MLIKSLITFHKHHKIIKNVCANENLLPNLSQLFGANFKIDWVGRIYVVLNPQLKNMKPDLDTQIFEHDEEGMNNNSFVEKWIMERCIIAEKFIKNNELFDILTYKITRLDDYENYLLVLVPLAWLDFQQSLKRFGWWMLGISIVALITLLIIFLI